VVFYTLSAGHSESTCREWILIRRQRHYSRVFSWWSLKLKFHGTNTDTDMDNLADFRASANFPVQLATSRKYTTIRTDLSTDSTNTRACTRVNMYCTRLQTYTIGASVSVSVPWNLRLMRLHNLLNFATVNSALLTSILIVPIFLREVSTLSLSLLLQNVSTRLAATDAFIGGDDELSCTEPRRARCPRRCACLIIPRPCRHIAQTLRCFIQCCDREVSEMWYRNIKQKRYLY